MSGNSIRAAAALALAGAAVLLPGGSAQAQRAVPVNRAFDSAAVVAALRDVPAPAPGVPPLFTAVFVGGQLQTVQPAEEGLPQAYAETVAALLQAHARTMADGEGPRRFDLRMFYLWVEGGAAARISEHKPVQVLPQLLNVAQLQRSLRQVAAREKALRNAEEASAREALAGEQPTEPHRPRPLETATLHVRIRVEADGSSTGHEVVRASNNPRIDQEVLRLVQQLRFQPATVDGRVVRAWAVLPITVQY